MAENHYQSAYTGTQIDAAIGRIVNGDLDRAVASAVSAKDGAQNAYTGVQTAIKNIPAGSTPIVNDLTTGGTKMALSAEQGKVLGVRSNPNMLDNAYFPNAINQRGKTEYTERGYCIDRWFRSESVGAVVSLVNGGLRLDNTNGSAVLYLRQSPERTVPAGDYVVSAVVDEYSSAGSGTMLVYMGDSSGSTIKGKAITGPGLFDASTTVSESGKINRVQLQIPVGCAVTIRAIKLECGTAQSLAHIDSLGNVVLNEIPNYETELAKCQRYQMELANASGTNILGVGVAGTEMTFFVPLPVSMRASPAITVSNLYAHNGGLNQKLPITAMSVYSRSANGVWVRATTTGFTPGEAYYLRCESGSVFLDANP